MLVLNSLWRCRSALGLGMWMSMGSLACDTTTDTLSDTDTDVVVDTAADFCEGQPYVAWENFGNGFMIENCQACHGSFVVDRYGAPEAVTFDTEYEVWAWADRILARAGVEDADMPPMGGVQEDDRVMLEIWLLCDSPPDESAEGTTAQ